MGDGSNGGHPQGTEYTLQGEFAPNFCPRHGWTDDRRIGVMRFLQTEWHRHERDRNAWEIERAEMKSRIGRLEGELRTSKRLHESLGKHVRLMESALKKERDKVKKLSNNETVEDPADPKDIARDSVNFLKGVYPILHVKSLCAFIEICPRSPTLPVQPGSGCWPGRLHELQRLPPGRRAG